MRILLIDIDSKIPNLALKKIEKYHKDRGDEIIWNFPLFKNLASKIYVSCVFTQNRNKCEEWEGIAEIGGSGYDLKKQLPTEIENVKPKINLGFTTRGCIRKCPFCVVPEKEGRIRVVGDIYDIWDGKSNNITLLDNNILALPRHFEKICNQLIKEKIQVDFNQGLDIRLLTEKTCQLLKKIKIKTIRFAWDDMAEEKIIEEKVKLLRKYKISKCMFYMLIGFNTTFEEDMYRKQKINGWGYDTYVMLYNNKEDRFLREFAGWNNMFYFRKRSFKDYLKARKYEYLLKEQENG